jgi:hypothetical protein
MTSEDAGDNPPDIAETHNQKATLRIRPLFIADTHIQRAKRRDPADFDHVHLRFMRLSDE